jgi:hypothetical protein
MFVESTTAWPFAAITLAAGRLSEVLRRDSGRHVPRRGGSASFVGLSAIDQPTPEKLRFP